MAAGPGVTIGLFVAAQLFMPDLGVVPLAALACGQLFGLGGPLFRPGGMMARLVAAQRVLAGLLLGLGGTGFGLGRARFSAGKVVLARSRLGGFFLGKLLLASLLLPFFGTSALAAWLCAWLALWWRAAAGLAISNSATAAVIIRIISASTP
jgi:hypothetical protein